MLLQWLDNGPFKALPERSLGSLARSLFQMEVGELSSWPFLHTIWR
jgi:hypothetical protein